MLRLRTVGRRTGEKRIAILGYIEDGSSLVTHATNGWADPEPASWVNLLAHPDAMINLVDGSRPVRGRAANENERPSLWARWAVNNKQLDAYAARDLGRPRASSWSHGRLTPRGTDMRVGIDRIDGGRRGLVAGSDGLCPPRGRTTIFALPIVTDGRARDALLLTIGGILVKLPILLVASRLFSLNGIWAAGAVSELAVCVVSLVMLKRFFAQPEESEARLGALTEPEPAVRPIGLVIGSGPAAE